MVVAHLVSKKAYGALHLVAHVAEQLGFLAQYTRDLFSWNTDNAD